MSTEETLDSNTRNSILAAVAGLGKKELPVLENKTPGINVSNTDLTSTAPKKFGSGVNEVSKSGKTVCTNCNHKVWSDGEDWLHSGKEHDSNCECREVKISGVNESVNKVKTTKFDSTTSSQDLLEACINKRQEIQAEDDANNLIADEDRRKIIERINTQPNMSIISSWKF